MRIKSNNLDRAKVIKNDEFYTQYHDIEKECNNYLGHFKDKVIYCNCDTADSNFVKYFTELKNLGMIKDVIYSGGLNGLDFRSTESIDLLKQSDIVISNPPFSLFREYVTQLVEYDKKFLIIGNFNAIKYKYVFPLIKENKLWTGTLPFCKSMLFDVPDTKVLLDSGFAYKTINGIAKAIVSGTWFTNLEYTERKFLSLVKTYYGNESDYPKYDNFDAINVNDKRHIPNDYYGVMGVPTTFLDKYNSEQFIILGLDRDLTTDRRGSTICGRNLYTRIFIQRKVIANDNNKLTFKAA